MAITSSDIDNKSFSVERKGYSIEEVDIFLETVSKEVGMMNNTISHLESKSGDVSDDVVNQFKKEKEDLLLTISQRDHEIKHLKQVIEKKTDESSVISQALIVAQRSADSVVENANKKGDNIIKDAKDKAERIVSDANSEKENIEKQLVKLKEKKTKAKESYEKMLREIVETMNIHLEDIGSGKFKNPAFGKTGAIKKKPAAHSNTSKAAPAGATSASKPIKPQSTKAAAPVKPEPQKDFSGFGDTDFGGGSID